MVRCRDPVSVHSLLPAEATCSRGLRLLYQISAPGGGAAVCRSGAQPSVSGRPVPVTGVEARLPWAYSLAPYLGSRGARATAQSLLGRGGDPARDEAAAALVGRAAAEMRVSPLLRWLPVTRPGSLEGLARRSRSRKDGLASRVY